MTYYDDSVLEANIDFEKIYDEGVPPSAVELVSYSVGEITPVEAPRHSRDQELFIIGGSSQGAIGIYESSPPTVTGWDFV